MVRAGSWLYGLFFVMGVAGSAFVLTWPIGREVNPPKLAGVSVAVVNLGGLLGAALSQADLVAAERYPPLTVAPGWVHRRLSHRRRHRHGAGRPRH